MTGVLICYFIVTLPPHGHDGTFTLLLSLATSLLFLSFFWGSASIFVVQVNIEIRLISAQIEPHDPRKFERLLERRTASRTQVDSERLRSRAEFKMVYSDGQVRWHWQDSRMFTGSHTSEHLAACFRFSDE
jgi:hypothetical protein